MADRVHILHHRKIICNQKGFSLIEILVVIGLSAVVVLGNTMFLNDFMKRMSAYEKESSEESDLAVLNTMALNILKKASLSFNRLNLVDDKKLNFFDYYPDMPMGSFGDSESRIYTMDTTEKYFYVLSSDEGKYESTVYDPVHAYVVAAAAADLSSDGTVAYRYLNSVPDLYDSNGTKATKKAMTQIFGERWADGKIFVVTCPTYLRPVSNASVDLLVAPRMPSFIGKVSSDDLSALLSSEAGVNLNNTHPVSLAAYGSLNNYFRTLPTVGGAAPFVKIEPAVVGRFILRNSATSTGYFDLYMQSLTPKGYGEDIQVAQKIKTVTFKRKSVTLPLISMEIQK